MANAVWPRAPLVSRHTNNTQTSKNTAGLRHSDLFVMSSKKEEREALRRSAADSIRPGWNPQNIDAWNPKEDSPQLKHLTEVAKDRGFNGMGFKNRAKAVEWLTLNGPPEAGTGETTLSTFGADTLDFSGTTSPAPLSLNPLATTPYLPPSRHFKGVVEHLYSYILKSPPYIDRHF